MKNSLKIRKTIYLILLLLIILADLYIIKYLYDTYQSKQESKLLNEISIEKSSNDIPINTDMDKNTSKETTEQDIAQSQIQLEKTERMLKLEELQKQNSDIIGWIEIENTDINYPVLQGSDNDYYMKHNYKKEYSTNGSVFLDKDYVWEPPSANLLIYGHNMKNNTMFQSLLKYKNKDYYDAHPTIRFTTNKEDMIFEIISGVYYTSEKNVFRYYYFVNSKNEQEFNEFVYNAKKVSLYDTGKTATYGEQLMTLSTCSYHTTNGRFVVIARKQ